MRLSSLAVVLSIVALVACVRGGGPAAGAVSTPSGGSGNVSKPIERWGILYGADWLSGKYRLALVAADGIVVTRLTPQAQFHATQRELNRLRNKVGAGDMVPTVLVPYSASNDRLFYLDGAVLKYVTPGSGGGTVRSLPSGNREHAFAVSADDRRVAIAEFDYSVAPPAFHLWVEDLEGGNRVDLKLSGIGYAWPYGWYKDKLIVIEAKPYTTVSVEGVWGFPFPTRAHLIDARTGVESATLCSWPVADRALCSDHESLSIESWDGSRIQEPQVGPPECYPTGVLSPDGSSIASRDVGPNPYDGNQCVGYTIIISDASGHRSKLSLDGYPGAFLDASHLIYMTQVPDQFQQYAMNVVDLSTGSTRPIDFSGYDIHAFRELPPLES